MELQQKRLLKVISLELRHLLEGHYDSAGTWHPGDLEQRLAAIGVRRDREPVRVEELPHLAPMDRKAREVVDAYLALRGEAGAAHEEAVAEFVRETAYTWANRLLALRCMEARELVDEVIYQKAAYGGRSLEHHRLAQRHPELCAGEDDGLLAVLDKVFVDRARHLPMLFDPDSPGVALKPSAAAIKRCMAILSESRKVGDEEVPTSEIFRAPDAFGWAYQYWNTEEKDRVFEKVRTQKGAKIEGPDIIPATQLYTEPYMVKFLVQNSLGATWMGMHPESKLCEKWEYYVRDADRAPVENKSIAEITFLDPACGSGHFLLEAFDLFYEMYEEEMKDEAEDYPSSLESPRTPAEIYEAILTRNLFGIDIDARAVQIAEVALWMKAAERAFGFEGRPANLVAAVASHLKGPLWEEFLGTFRAEPSIGRVLRKFGEAMEHIDELGSLARPDEDLRAIIREEHATWERQVRERKEANYLFAEMAEDKLSGQLPFHEVSDEEFGERMLHRVRAAIHAFTEKARETGAFQDQFLGSEAAVGFKLLDVLGRKYDVVAANPPYMGNKTMPAVLRQHLVQFYADGKRDLFVAFMLRCRELGKPRSLVGMVTQQSWMFASGLSAFRGAADVEHTVTGFLHDNIIQVLAHLGPGGFSEISGEVVSSALVIFYPTPPGASTSTLVIRAVEGATPAEKAAVLRQRPQKLTFTFSQLTLVSLPSAPVAYWLGESFLRLLAASNRVEAQADVLPGLKTGEDARFLRFHWETPPSRAGWVPYSKGGRGYAKWYGQNEYCLDWRNGQTPYQQYRDSRQPYSDYYFRDGYTFSAASKGALGVRRLVAGAICGAKGPGIFPKNSSWIVALLNSRLSSYLIRGMTVGLDILVENVRALPLPACSGDVRYQVEQVLVDVEQLSTIARSWDPIDRGFRGCPKRLEVYAAETCLLTCEGVLEELVGTSYGLSPDALAEAYGDVGYHVGVLPLVCGRDALPSMPGLYLQSLSFVNEHIAACERQSASTGQMSAIKEHLRSEYEASQSCRDNRADDQESSLDEDEDGEVQVTLGNVLPTESFLEDVSQRLGIHPISVFSLLREGIEKEGWRCLSEEQREWQDSHTVQILRLLGHRWPKEIEAGDATSEWADADGIIPLTETADERSLFECLVKRKVSCMVRAATRAVSEMKPETDPPNGMNSVLREFAEIMGKPLDQWLATEFFKHHTSQFKKRPIAWQIQSGRFTARTQPAFACLVYYHKVDGDLLPKIRTQYVGPLRQRLETELRGIEGVAASARSERQQARQSELGDLIKELQDFDASLGGVQERGFETKGLREFAIQDALLCMKSRWLRRLGEAVAAGPLSGWKNEAAAAAINENLPGWIDEAFAHLDYQCSRVGPAEWRSAEDPTPRTLAAAICEEPESMVAGAVEGANQRWWGRLDDQILAPLRREMSQKREGLKAIRAEREEMPPGSDAAMQLEDEEHRLKGKIKELKDQIDRIKQRGDRLREMIAGWRCAEAAGWEPWLARQPMYDAISSVDGRRQPPATVAEWIAQERSYVPDINDGVRVNIAPVQKAGLLAADVLAKKDLDKAIADRAEWRADERRWCREGKLPQPGWWPER